MENGLTHAVRILCALPFALPYVDIGEDLLPSCLDVEFGVILFGLCLLLDVFTSSVQFFILLLGKKLLE
jgi:hypothetical protein